jgi:hypothetical protein
MAKDVAGMDESQADSDRKGWKISPEMTTGGTVKDLSEGGSEEVGYSPEENQTKANKG